MVKVSGMQGWNQTEGAVCLCCIPTLQDPRDPPRSSGPHRGCFCTHPSEQGLTSLGCSCHPPRETARTGCLLFYLTATEITGMRSPGAGDDIQHSAKSRSSSPPHWGQCRGATGATSALQHSSSCVPHSSGCGGTGMGQSREGGQLVTEFGCKYVERKEGWI